VKGRGMSIRIHPDVERFWGKPLGEMDLELCEVLGWIKLIGNRGWCLTERTKGYDGQIYRSGTLPGKGQLKIDDELFNLLLHFHRRDLDPLLTRRDFRLRLMLTLVDLELSGIVVRRVEKDGTTHFAATEYLAMLRERLDDDDGPLVRPVVRVDDELVWDCIDAADDETPQTTIRH
jgi:hypothetical protein